MGWRAELTGSVMPGIGRVTSFQFQSGSCPQVAGGSFDFQVLRPVGNDQYQVVGNTGTQSDPCDGALHSYPVFINVQPGDVLGVYVVSAWEGVIGVAAPESFRRPGSAERGGHHRQAAPHLVQQRVGR